MLFGLGKLNNYIGVLKEFSGESPSEILELVEDVKGLKKMKKDASGMDMTDFMRYLFSKYPAETFIELTNELEDVNFYLFGISVFEKFYLSKDRVSSSNIKSIINHIGVLYFSDLALDSHDRNKIYDVTIDFDFWEDFYEKVIPEKVVDKDFNLFMAFLDALFEMINKRKLNDYIIAYNYALIGVLLGNSKLYWDNVEKAKAVIGKKKKGELFKGKLAKVSDLFQGLNNRIKIKESYLHYFNGYNQSRQLRLLKAVNRVSRVHYNSVGGFAFLKVNW